MHNLIAYFQRASQGKTVFLLFVITNLVYASMLVYSLPLVSSYAPESVLFDMSPTGYSYHQAVALLTSLGVDGRSAYLTVQLPLDFIYPGMFSVSYALLITWLLKQYTPEDSKLFYIAFIPFVAGGFDYLENIGIIAMLKNFPHVSENLVTTTSALTIVKSGATTLFFVLLILAVIQIIQRRLGIGLRS
ncbi:Uncharacterised protein [BD1-7 clade bacterium]|uniref:DUF4386 domain-containing protein n=1 Tax=BD1-7 clade bacterium TaxID=2029982 RepID=A0A5S9NQ09_9GAMM|nr:Uncharacterised protein [BD1-7 clade bacterium]